jgi:hypothetical protein
MNACTAPTTPHPLRPREGPTRRPWGLSRCFLPPPSPNTATRLTITLQTPHALAFPAAAAAAAAALHARTHAACARGVHTGAGASADR